MTNHENPAVGDTPGDFYGCVVVCANQSTQRTSVCAHGTSLAGPTGVGAADHLALGCGAGRVFYGAGLVGTAPCRQKGFGFSHRPSGSPTPCQAPGQPRNRLG